MYLKIRLMIVNVNKKNTRARAHTQTLYTDFVKSWLLWIQNRYKLFDITFVTDVSSYVN